MPLSSSVGRSFTCLLLSCLTGCAQPGSSNSLLPVADAGSTGTPEVSILGSEAGAEVDGSVMQGGPTDGALADTARVDLASIEDVAGPADVFPPASDVVSTDAQGIPGKPFPGVVAEKISNDTPTRLMVGPDERRVAFSNRAPPGLGSGCGFAGDLSVAVLTAQGPKVTQVAATGAGLGEASFFSTGSHIAFIQGICGDRPSVVMAHAEGVTPARNLMTADVFPRLVVRGGTVAWVAREISGSQSSYQVGAARIDGASVPSFPRPSGMRGMSLDPTGIAIDYDDATGGRFRVVTSADSVAASVSFSDRGSKAALLSQGRLVLQNVDGSDPREIATDCRCGNILFSPDGTRMAYEGPESPTDTVGKVFVVPVTGGAKTTIGLPDGDTGITYSTKVFSPGGRWLTRRNLNARLAIADSLQSGTYAIVEGPQTPIDFTLGDDFIAYRGAAVSVWVAALPFANPTALLTSVSYPLAFQPTAGSTRLAVLNNRETTTYLADLELYDVRTRARIVAVRDIQGGGRTGFELVRNPFWAGKVVVFAFNARTPAGGQATFDLGAVTEDGSVSGTLATDVVQYEWYREAKAPGQLFFVRSRAGGGGLWTLTVPR